MSQTLFEGLFVHIKTVLSSTVVVSYRLITTTMYVCIQAAFLNLFYLLTVCVGVVLVTSVVGPLLCRRVIRKNNINNIYLYVLTYLRSYISGGGGMFAHTFSGGSSSSSSSSRSSSIVLQDSKYTLMYISQSG